ncbi:MAG: Holliday junction resolvase RuvX [Candidatus Paceibacterota bacterium]
MRFMGIDYGSKRVGIALSDESGNMAFPETVLINDDKLAKAIADIIETKQVTEIVIGHSLHTDGSENPLHTRVKEFITELTLAVGLPIHLEPEQYSTQEAIRFQGRTDKTDASAAAIILNSFLNKRT